VTVGHADSYGWGLGVEVGNWGIGREVVPIESGISNACVMSWKRRGNVEQIQLLERNNNCFYTN
jgi:hypothetical protein